LRVPAAGRPKRTAAWATAAAPSRRRLVLIAVALLVVLLFGGLWVMPVDQFVSANMPALPQPPLYPSRYSSGPKPVPQADLLLPSTPAPPPNP
jgi:hypothetical protein